VLEGLRWIVHNTDADIAMKIDPDALVIGPFAHRLEEAFEQRPEVGLFGAHDRTPNGAPRDYTMFRPRVRRLARWVQLRPTGVYLATGKAALIRRLVIEARRSGYEWGEHVLGGAIALRRSMIDRWRRLGVIDEPTVFKRTRLFDDPVLGILTYSSGLRLGNLVSDGDPFAISWRGLPDLPEALLARGYGIVHSVKNDQNYTEQEIRAFFGALRPTAAMPPNPGL
jgi:hypothetical protein